MVSSLIDGPIPRLDNVRRVPSRYHQILSLELMKQCQCIVVGAAQGVLTVAITDQQQKSIIESLEKLTGYAIFTVLIDSARMRLLISRIERCEWQERKKKLLGRPCYLHRLQLHSIIVYLLR